MSLLTRSWNWLFRRRVEAYQAVFLGDATKGQQERVLADLKRFCHVEKSTFDPQSPHAIYIAEGRREVWLRIMAHTFLNDEQVRRLYEQVKQDEVDGDAL
jgi:hypothetical protein